MTRPFHQIALMLLCVSVSIHAEPKIDCGHWQLPTKTCDRLEAMINQTSYMSGGDDRFDEMPEQIITTHYLKKEQNVLELGSNVGRNTMIISKILNGKKTFYSSESSPVDLEKTRTNLKANQVWHDNIHLIPAISKVPLEQKGWVTRPATLFGWLSRWRPVETTQMPDVKFDAIIADCEGCLLPMSKDYPELLQNANMIILENDWKNAQEDFEMHTLLEKAGFKTVYAHEGPEWLPSPQYDHFYEVLQKAVE